MEGATRVTTEFFTFNTNQNKWLRAFNKATFFNYDIENFVKVNDVIIPPALVGPDTGEIYPMWFSISLNKGEINDTYFNIVFSAGATTNHLVVVTTSYDNGLTPDTE